jgi:hypothetical protein
LTIFCGEKIGVYIFAQTTASFCKKNHPHIGFREKNAIFPPKIGKNRWKL